MRKLNTKNKTYIIVLSIFAAIVFIALAVFAYFKIQDMNVKYNIYKDSYFYNSKQELIYVKETTYAKKDFLGRYYANIDNQKVYLGNSGIIYNASSRNITLLGVFYEILKTGEVEKLKGESVISCTNANRIFKVDDRKYLIVGPNLKSTDGLLSANDYIIIELDKVGNGYIYNKDMNIKSFKDLYIDTGDFKLKVNEEILTMGDVEINLSDINGSTNEYDEKKKGTNQAAGKGDGSGGDNPIIDGNGGGEDTKTEDVIKVEKYVARKTSIVNTTAGIDSITISYIVYDPFMEYKGVYFVLFDENGEKLGQYEMDMSLTTYTINGLKAHRNYKMNFYYIYQNENGNNVDTLFDTVNVQTKNFKAHLSLEMVTDNSVRYILRVDDGYVLSSGKVELSIISGDEVISTTSHVLTGANLTAAAGNDGFADTFSDLDLDGDFVKITFKDCTYQGEKIDVTASYKFII